MSMYVEESLGCNHPLVAFDATLYIRELIHSYLNNVLVYCLEVGEGFISFVIIRHVLLLALTNMKLLYKIKD